LVRIWGRGGPGARARARLVSAARPWARGEVWGTQGQGRRPRRRAALSPARRGGGTAGRVSVPGNAILQGGGGGPGGRAQGAAHLPNEQEQPHRGGSAREGKGGGGSPAARARRCLVSGAAGAGGREDGDTARRGRGGDLRGGALAEGWPEWAPTRAAARRRGGARARGGAGAHQTMRSGPALEGRGSGQRRAGADSARGPAGPAADGRGPRRARRGRARGGGGARPLEGSGGCAAVLCAAFASRGVAAVGG
jgi:hypothetical protein